MKPRRVWGRVLIGLFVLVLVVVGVALIALSRARIELTAHGVHQRLLVPLPRGAIGLRMYAGTGEQVFVDGFLAGPVVRRASDGRWSAEWFCQDRLQRASGNAGLLQVRCAGKEQRFQLADLPVPTDVAAMPERVVVLSDLEGNSRFLEAALRKLAVVDTNGQWQYGQGHLVVLGDSVDRGRDVFAVLWRLHDLAAQAGAAGGAVHVLLGNHEQYLLRGNVSRTDLEYRYALRQLGGYSRAFAADTVLGAWLRQQPVVVKLGDVLFVHGGLSPEVAGSGLSIAQLNQAMRRYWRVASQPVPHSAALDAVLGRAGVTQYRGYFRGMEGHYPAATDADVDRVLAQFGAEQIVVAHTLVERVQHLHEGRVIAVDVNDDEARPEVLVYEHGQPRVVDLGIGRSLGDRQPTHLRDLNLLDRSDWRLLGAMYRQYRNLSAIPWPY